MKIVSFLNQDGATRCGLFVGGKTYDLQLSAESISITLPSNVIDLLEGGEIYMSQAREVEKAILDSRITEAIDQSKIKPLAPVPTPPSCRDGYAFRQHVATARRNRGVDMIPEFDQYPVFYFTNHNAIIGQGDLVVEDDHLYKLDFELEAAIVIGKRGKNIKAADADSYIAGYTIMNDFSARVLQMEEMKLNLGPAKGKDFATAIGPWLVTPDELQNSCEKTNSGDKYNLRMTAHHNGELISDGNLKDMNWTFAEIIERVSYGVEIFPGDVIGSGTVGTGCYLELNGSRTIAAKEKGESYDSIWLKPEDTIDLEIEGLGKLSHRIKKEKESRSILALKKNV